MRGVFSNLLRRNILKDVTTLVLDGLSVTSELIGEIVLQPSFNVRILSIREVRNLNERKLMQLLEYAVRPSRPANTPRLKGLYIFGPKDAPTARKVQRKVHSYPPGIAPLDTGPLPRGVLSSQGAQIGVQWNQKSEEELSRALVPDGDNWYVNRGKIIAKQPGTGWADTMMACKGLIFFDAVLCNGPRHSPLILAREHPLNEAYLPPSIATFAVRGCNTCHGAPEGWSAHGTAPPEALPLLAPVSFHCTTIKAATRPSYREDGTPPSLIARCQACLQNRYCQSCQKFWCEDCYDISGRLTSHYPEKISSKAPNPGESAQQGGAGKSTIKVHMGLCVEDCLVGEMMAGAGSNGMWG